MKHAAVAPRVSICLQTYQHAAYIRDAIESVLMQQTDFEWELLIGEDGSTDGTREICIEYAQRDARILLALNSRDDVIRVKGRATGRRNFLNNLNRARGEYIALLPGDDYWTHPHKLQEQVNILDAHPDCIACHHWYQNRYESGLSGPSATTQGYCKSTITELRDIFANRVRLKARTLMFRNVIDDQFFPPWFNQVLYGDVPLSMLLGKHGKFYFIDEPWAVYRITGRGLSESGSKSSYSLRGITRIYRSWIEIWQYGDRHYAGQYHRETSATVRHFYVALIRQYLAWIKRQLFGCLNKITPDDAASRR